MYVDAESVSVEGDEQGFALEVFGYANTPDADEVRLTINIQGIDLDSFYDQVKGRIGPYLQEKEAAFAEFRAGVKRGENARALYDADVAAHERMTGQHAPFLCSPEDVDESGGMSQEEKWDAGAEPEDPELAAELRERDAQLDGPHSTVGEHLAESRAMEQWKEDKEAYDTSDPKHPDWHSIHADIWDARDGK